MSILAYVSADVRTVSATSSQQTIGTLGEAINKGQPVRKSSADNKYYLCDGDTVDPVSAEFDGYAKDSGAEDDVIGIQTGGTIYLGVAATPGMPYFVSATAGQTESGDTALASGLNPTMVGYGDDDGNIVINKLEIGITIPT